MRIVFMGTPEFALPSLNKLIHKHNVLCVVTQPDKPRGRGMKLTFTPIKLMAQQLSIPLLQPEKIGEAAQRIRELLPDLIVVVACGHILTKEILEIPKLGCVNLHASLLPELRGPEPIARSIISGKQKTGLTVMWMDEGVDAGDIIAQREVEILPDDTKGSLEQKMALTGADFLCETLKLVEGGNAPRKKQIGDPTYAPMIKDSDCLVDWSKPAEQIHNLVRGLNPFPSAHTFLVRCFNRTPNASIGEGKRLKIHKSRVAVPIVSRLSCNPGEIVEIKGDQILAATGKGVFSILEIQPEGKRTMSAKEYLAGHRLKQGMKFG